MIVRGSTYLLDLYYVHFKGSHKGDTFQKVVAFKKAVGLE